MSRIMKNYWMKKVKKYISENCENRKSISTRSLPSLPSHIERYCKGEFTITSELGALLWKLISEYQLSNVIEFGAGSSSAVIANALAKIGGGELTSVEQNPEWCSDRWEKAKSVKDVDSEMIVSGLKPKVSISGCYFGYEKIEKTIERRSEFDLLFIDGPQYFIGREGTLPSVLPHLSNGAFIVLDDAGRSDEQQAIYSWLKSYPGLKLQSIDYKFGGKGVALMRSDWAGRKQFSMLPWLVSVRRTFLRWGKIKYDRNSVKK